MCSSLKRLVRIPAKLDSDSKASWTLIPGLLGQPKFITQDADRCGILGDFVEDHMAINRLSMRNVFEVLRLSVADARIHCQIARAIIVSPSRVGKIPS